MRTNSTAPAPDPRFRITAEIRRKPVQISRSTVERKKRRGKGRFTAKPGSLLRNRIPVKVFRPGDEQRAGFCETDTVSQDGGNASGEFCFTLTVTDTATQRTEEGALKNKARRRIREAMDEVHASFPVPLKGIDRDKGGEFVNTAMKTRCEQGEISFTRAGTTKTTTVRLNRKTGRWSVRPRALPVIPTRGPRRRCTRPPIPCPTISILVPGSLIKHGTRKGRRRRSMTSRLLRMNGLRHGMMSHRK
jgi:hypothetical protein